MWTAEIVDIKKHELDFEIVVNFSNGDVTKGITFRISEPSSVKQIIANQISQYQKIENLDLTLGVVDFTVPVPVLPSEEELAKIEYSNKRNKLVVLKQDLDLGLIAQAEYDTALDELKASK